MFSNNQNFLKIRRLSLIILFISIIINMIGGFFSNLILAAIGILLLTIFVLANLIFWRCPSCKKRLPIKFDYKNNVDEVLCPYCNENFLYSSKKE